MLGPFAYRIPDVPPALAPERMQDGTHAGLARIKLAGPWQYSAHPEGGCLATWKGTDVPRLMDLPEPTRCEDGLLFYVLGALKQADLAKPLATGETIEVECASGAVLSILLAAASPRKLRCTGPTGYGEPLTDYGRLAFAVHDRIGREEKLTTDDADLRRLVFLAVAQRYRVTEEAFDLAGWVSTADVDPILCAIFGADPKSCAVDTAI